MRNSLSFLRGFLTTGLQHDPEMQVPSWEGETWLQTQPRGKTKASTNRYAQFVAWPLHSFGKPSVKSEMAVGRMQRAAGDPSRSQAGRAATPTVPKHSPRIPQSGLKTHPGLTTQGEGRS